LELKVGLNVFLIRPADEGLGTLIVAGKGSHISTVPKIYNHVRLKINDEFTKPVRSIIVEVCVGVLVRDY
jgi:hypothetical protein